MTPFYRSFLKVSVIFILFMLLGCSSDTNTASTPTAVASENSDTTAEATAVDDEILVVTGEFAPFSSEALEGGGFATEIVKAVFNEMGRSVRIEFYPWERGEAMVASGEAWGSFPYAVTEERRESYDFTDRLYAQAAMQFFYYGTAMQDVTFSELSDLQPYRIGGSLGHWYLPLFEEAGLNVEISNDDLSNLRKLQAGRIDLVPLGYVSGYWLINTEFPEDAEQFGFIAQYIGEIVDDAVMVSRAYPNTEEIRLEFNAALARVVESGEFQEIVGRYGLDAEQLLLQAP